LFYLVVHVSSYIGDTVPVAGDWPLASCPQWFGD